MSSLVTAALAIVVALLLAPVLSKLPEPTLGVMVLVPVLGLIDVAAMKRLFALDRMEFALAMIVMLFALVAGLLPAVAVGVLLTGCANSTPNWRAWASACRLQPSLNSARETAGRWPWWQELAAQGRYAATLTDAAGPPPN